MVNVNARMTFLCNNEFTEEELHTPILLQESKKLTHIKIRDEDYFDVDFAFDPARPEPKAIYIKRKHFKDINPALLNPENVLATTMAQAAITDSLKQEIRFTWLLELGNFCKGPTSPQDKLHKSLGFLLPKTSQDKLKLVSERIIPT